MKAGVDHGGSAEATIDALREDVESALAEAALAQERQQLLQLEVTELQRAVGGSVGTCRHTYRCTATLKFLQPAECTHSILTSSSSRFSEETQGGSPCVVWVLLACGALPIAYRQPSYCCSWRSEVGLNSAQRAVLGRSG
jgi:hypothetical protein